MVYEGSLAPQSALKDGETFPIPQYDPPKTHF
jgi:hypothetical protein